MAKRRLFSDKTVIILITDNSGKFERVELSYEKVTRIQFEKCEVRKLFKKVPSEKILIFTKNKVEPYFILKSKEKDLYDEYKQELVDFTKNNRVSLINNLNT